MASWPLRPYTASPYLAFYLWSNIYPRQPPSGTHCTEQFSLPRSLQKGLWIRVASCARSRKGAGNCWAKLLVHRRTLRTCWTTHSCLRMESLRKRESLCRLCTVPIACTRCLANHVTPVAQRIRRIDAPKRCNAFVLLTGKSIPKGPNTPAGMCRGSESFPLVERGRRIYFYTVYTLQFSTPHFVLASCACLSLRVVDVGVFLPPLL